MLIRRCVLILIAGLFALSGCGFKGDLTPKPPKPPAEKTLS